MNNRQNEPLFTRSPCIGVCALDEKDICIACRRSAVEIGEWGVMTEPQKADVMELIVQRIKQEREGKVSGES